MPYWKPGAWPRGGKGGLAYELSEGAWLPNIPHQAACMHSVRKTAASQQSMASHGTFSHLDLFVRVVSK